MEPVLTTRDILELLPHRFPFLLVDKVISIEPQPDKKSRVGRRLVALKNVTMNEPFFTGHFPNLPIMPGVLQIEALAQAACLSIINKGDPSLDFFIAAVQEAKFRRPVVPGDTLLLHSEVIRDRGSMLMVKTYSTVEGQVASEATLLAKISLQSARERS